MLMDQVLIIIGASVFGVLGSVHLAYTFFTNKFEAFDASVTEAMKTTSPVITKETSLWNAWVGFNASHSLGAILVAGLYVPLAAFHMDLVRESIWFSTLPAFIGLSYLVLAKKYWFKIPLIGILLSSICFVGAAVLINT